MRALSGRGSVGSVNDIIAYKKPLTTCNETVTSYLLLFYLTHYVVCFIVRATEAPAPLNDVSQGAHLFYGIETTYNLS